MSSYKVPQDVEADDKLLGPFSFRQFIYLLVVAAMGGLAYVLYQIFPLLVVIPIPVMLFFLALALPLRKDQPMEIYLAAILSFYLKSRRRMWDPDGMETLVQIAAPRNVETQRTKNVSVSEAEQRLRYLSDLSDSRGWSVRGVNAPQGNSMNPDVFNEAQQLPDTLDDDAAVSQNLDYMLSQSNQRRHDEMLDRFQQSAATPAATPPTPAATPPTPAATTPAPVAPPPLPDPYASLGSTVYTQEPETPTPQYNPYPASMNQSVIQPMSVQQSQSSQRPTPPVTPAPPVTPTESNTSAEPVSPDIIRLANNADLSIETIAREAHRITEKDDDEKEVVISLR